MTEPFFEPIKTTKYAILGPNRELMLLTAATPPMGGDIFQVTSNGMRLLQHSYFVYDITNDITIKCRDSYTKEDIRTIARFIQLNGKDYGMVSFAKSIFKAKE